MEILIFQYFLLVLISLWWLKPSSQVVVAKKYKILFFDLACVLVLMFFGLYTLVQEISFQWYSSKFYWVLNSTMDILVFLLIPASYIYLRNHPSPKVFERKDLIHLLPCVLYLCGFVFPHLVRKAPEFDIRQEQGLLYKVFCYCVFGIYLLLVIKNSLKKYSVIFASKKDHASAKHQKGKGEAQALGENTGLQEIFVGSAHLDGKQLAKMDSSIRSFLETAQPFLQHGYSLRQLAHDTSTPPHHLSAFINQYYHSHFNDFINEYRVYYCQGKIKNNEWKTKTLEAIAEESGFNNRNTFTTAFKKVTGHNPSNYLKTVKEQQIA